MKTIHKKQLQVMDEQIVLLPVNSVILSVANQKGNISLWYLLDKETKELGQRKILIRGTGHNIEMIKSTVFIGTILLMDDDLVFHVFEELL